MVVEVAGEGAFDAAECFAFGFAALEEVLVVGAGFWVAAASGACDHVQSGRASCRERVYDDV